MTTANTAVSGAACAEERFAWERILVGIKIIYVTIAAGPLLALVFGLSFVSLVDPRRIDELTLLMGMMGFCAVYMLGVGGILFGLHAWCQVPAGFSGRGYAQSAFALTLATSGVTLLSCRWLTDRIVGPWLATTHASLLDFMLAASGGLAVICGLLFIRSVGLHLEKRDLVEHAGGRLRVLSIWLAGVILLAPLAEFLAVEAPWVRAVQGLWIWIGGGLVLIGCVAAVERMRSTLRSVLKP